MNLIKIGAITKTQGLKGEVRAKIVNNENTLIENGSEIFLNNKKYIISKTTNRNTFVVLKLKDINSIDEAESLINYDIYIKSDKFLKEDEFFVKDIIGFSVVDEKGNNLGVVSDIKNYGAGDVYVIENNNETFLFVNSRDVIIEFVFESKQIVVNSKILSEIAVYS